LSGVVIDGGMSVVIFILGGGPAHPAMDRQKQRPTTKEIVLDMILIVFLSSIFPVCP
jgi:hypothetical protein